MPRRVPASGKKRRESTMLKRAIKRGDVDPEVRVQIKVKKVKGRKGHLTRSVPTSNVAATRKLQSAFVKLPSSFLEESQVLSASLVLSRPIHASFTIFSDHADLDSVDLTLQCPQRPPWNFDMSKRELEKGEESVFSRWLTNSDAIVQKWRDTAKAVSSPEGQVIVTSPPTMPRSTTFFERNLDVWRQLWRVTEISEVILVLADARCPLLHFPPSLAAYLDQSKKRHILVLTKVDIVGMERVTAWTNYFHDRFPTLRIVLVQNYAQRDVSDVQQGHARYDPCIPDTFRHQLVESLRELHAELLLPPEDVQKDPKRLMHWKPRVKRDIDWGAVHHARGEKVGVAVPGTTSSAHGEIDDAEPHFLTIGVIGQPNVGKSSLLNALFGTQKVKASKAPGKTKHFQTLFWTSDVRLVDCPGLVMPSFVRMEMQALAGILPISRIASIPSCIHFASERLPLEEIFHLQHPNPSAPVEEDKRTWRDPQKRPAPRATEWTAMDIMTAYADSKGWMTAQAGRPDVKRAGNAILRSLAESRIPWGFWPPGVEFSTVDTPRGIWLPREGSVDQHDAEEDEESSADEEEDENIFSSQDEGSVLPGDDNLLSEDDAAPPEGGRFAMLSLGTDDPESGSNSDSEN